MELKKLDREILNLLLKDSSLSSREISEKVDYSKVTVLNHIKKMEEKGIIKNYTVNLNYEKIGYGLQIIIEMRISQGKLLKVEEKIANNERVSQVYDMTGDFDALILAQFKNRKEADQFIKKIQTYDFVERTRTHLVLNVIKKRKTEI